jgi:hypothetical protein
MANDGLGVAPILRIMTSFQILDVFGSVMLLSDEKMYLPVVKSLSWSF